MSIGAKRAAEEATTTVEDPRALKLRMSSCLPKFLKDLKGQQSKLESPVPK